MVLLLCCYGGCYGVARWLLGVVMVMLWWLLGVAKCC